MSSHTAKQIAAQQATFRQLVDVATIREDFPILHQRAGGDRLIYLDSGASSQKPTQVIEAMDSYYRTTHSNVHRGVYSIAATATELYEQSRRKIARFFNAKQEETVFTKNATEAINLVAYSWGRSNLGPGDVIVLTPMEHHANLVPWMIVAEQTGATIRHLDLTPEGQLRTDNLQAKLQGAKLFAFCGASNVLGTINPVKQLVARARSQGITTLVDMAQWAPHMPMDFADLGADFMAVTGHKMLGPTGIGVLLGRQELLDSMPPFLGGGDMIADVQLTNFTPTSLPVKFEAGTPPIAEAIGLGAAIDYLQDIGMDPVREHERTLTAYALQGLQSRFGDTITIHGPLDADKRGGTVSFSLQDIHPHDVSQVLDHHNVCVRAGHHCAKPLMRILGETATARASFHIYNDTDDVDALCNALDETVKYFGRQK